MAYLRWKPIDPKTASKRENWHKTRAGLLDGIKNVPMSVFVAGDFPTILWIMGQPSNGPTGHDIERVVKRVNNYYKKKKRTR